MHNLRRRVLAPLAALVAALALVGALLPTHAWAETNSVYTATATPSYSHPGTGVIEDSGGEASAALGQSMTESATYPAALVEYDANGTPFVTLRLMLMDNISDVSIAADPDWSGNFYGLGYNTMQTTDTTADFQVQEDPSAVFRIQMYVAPMGRYVVFYVTLSNLVAGNSDGFVQSVDTSATDTSTVSDGSGDTTTSDDAAAASPTAASPAAAAPAAAAASPAAGAATTGAAAGKTLSITGTAAQAGSATTGAASSGNGIQEYDANGNPGSSSTDGTMTIPVTGLVVGIVAGLVIGILAVGIAVALSVWLFTLRHRNAIERANGAAAVAAGQGAAAQAAPTIPRAAAQDYAAAQESGVYVPGRSGANPYAEGGQAGSSAQASETDETTVMPLPRPPKDSSDGLS